MLSKYKKNIDFCEIPTIYINLASRQDRNVHASQELIGKMKMAKVQRFNAIALANGAIGCSLSHLKCIERAKEMNWDRVFVCEDDITFTNPELFLMQIDSFFKKEYNWDVILVSGNNYPPFQEVDETCIRVTRCRTTTGYIVNKHYYDTLIDNIKAGIQNFLREPKLPQLFAVDMYWFHLQEVDNWYLIIPLTVVQAPGYSDIEKRQTNYCQYMLSLKK
jgi:GR25 family glycosyltransferase involved in LPS biosynthesis